MKRLALIFFLASLSLGRAEPLPSRNDGMLWAEQPMFSQSFLISGGGIDFLRKFAYDRESHVGTLAKSLDEGPKRGWPVVHIRSDWQWIFPHLPRPEWRLPPSLYPKNQEPAVDPAWRFPPRSSGLHPTAKPSSFLL